MTSTKWTTLVSKSVEGSGRVSMAQCSNRTVKTRNIWSLIFQTSSGRGTGPRLKTQPIIMALDKVRCWEIVKRYTLEATRMSAAGARLAQPGSRGAVNDPHFYMYVHPGSAPYWTLRYYRNVGDMIPRGEARGNGRPSDLPMLGKPAIEVSVVRKTRPC
jgi:hypothetical protein